MNQSKVHLVLILLLSASLVGCLSEDEDEQGIDLQVNYDSLNGIIVESYSDGELISTELVSINFDFSKTTSKSKLSTYGVDTNDGREPMEVSAEDSSMVIVEFSEHGIYEIVAYAIDDEGNREEMSLKARVELTIQWVEMNTDEPVKLVFDPTPSNEGEHPIMIEIESTIENPDPIQELGNGQSVQITWNIVDEYDDTCQRNSDQVDNGESITWTTIHFNTYLVHELIIDYEDGQDDININQTVSIIYSSD
jgi:hypothetical protein